MDTYKLAVCEDDEMIQKELCGLCGGILDEEGVSHEITVFSSAGELETALSEKGMEYDLLLLDIIMPGMTGMEFAQALRQRRDRTSIIFVTGNEEYLLEGYSVQPIHFLLKPVSREACEIEAKAAKAVLFAVQLLCLLAASIAAIVYTLFEMYSGECRGIMILGGAIPALSFLAEWSLEAALKKRKNEEEK